MLDPLRYIVTIDPVTLQYGFTVQFVDENGNALPWVLGFNHKSAGEADTEAQRVMQNVKKLMAA